MSEEIRGCRYHSANRNALAQLDTKMIEKCRDIESVFMDTVTRLEWKRVTPYAVRRRWYLRPRIGNSSPDPCGHDTP